MFGTRGLNQICPMQPKIAFAASASGEKVVVIRERVQRPIRFPNSRCVERGLCTSVGAPHVQPCSVLRWARLTLRLGRSFILPWQHFMSRWARLLSFRRPSLYYFENVLFLLRWAHVMLSRTALTSLGTLHASYISVDASSMLQWSHLMLRWARFDYFGGHRSWYLGNVFCTSVAARHAMLAGCLDFRWAQCMRRWTGTLYFRGRTSCCAGQVFCT